MKTSSPRPKISFFLTIPLLHPSQSRYFLEIQRNFLYKLLKFQNPEPDLQKIAGSLQIQGFGLQSQEE